MKLFGEKSKHPRQDRLVKFFTQGIVKKKVNPEELRLAINQMNKALGYNWRVRIDALNGDWNVCRRRDYIND